MKIDIDFQGQAALDESGRQEIQIGQEEFAFIDFGASENAAAVIEHIDHRKELGAIGEPGVGRVSAAIHRYLGSPPCKWYKDLPMANRTTDLSTRVPLIAANMLPAVLTGEFELRHIVQPIFASPNAPLQGFR